MNPLFVQGDLFTLYHGKSPLITAIWGICFTFFQPSDSPSSLGIATLEVTGGVGVGTEFSQKT